MKKSTKLLSVILAIIMIFSTMSVMASAQVTAYKTSANLTALDAYSPDGTVTRLSTEERLSILCDALDDLLASLNVKMDPIDLSVLGTLTINLDNINGLLATVDNVKSLISEGGSGFLVSLLSSSLGLIGDLNFDTWQKGMSREGTDHTTIVLELLEFLNANAQTIADALNNRKLDLGSIVGGFVDLSSVNKYIEDLPGLLNSLLFGLFERADDDSARITTLLNTSTNKDANNPFISVLNSYVKALFTRNQAYTSYKVDEAGNCISGHKLPTAAGYRNYYVFGNNKTEITVMAYDKDTATANGETAYVAERYKAVEDKYYKTAELDKEGKPTGEYVFQNSAGENLKYYEENSPWLDNLAADLTSGALNIDLTTNSVADLVYKFIPYIFEAMAPVVLNGSCKDLLLEWLGGTKTTLYEGKQGTADATAALAKLPADAQAFFQATAGDYLWEWSDYMVSTDGYHYYRYVLKDKVTEEWYRVDPSTANGMAKLFNWNWNVGDDFVDEFVPTSEGVNTAKGTNNIALGLNNFLYKALNTMFTAEAVAKIGWVEGDNTNIVSNLKKALQYVVTVDPEALFGTGYQTVYAGYYDMLIAEDSTDQEILTGLASIIVKALMPQITLPSAENLKGQEIGAVLACVVRELSTQLNVSNNYDALIYTDYNTKTLVSGKDNDYWLDLLLNMGVDIGLEYLPNLVDMGEDDATNGIGRLTAKHSNKTFTSANYDSGAWEDVVDWIIDWALSSDYEWCWRFGKAIDTTGLTISLKTDEDPWAKLDKILTDVLPLKQIINCTAATGKTWLETVLRDKLVLGIANLNFTDIIGKGTDYTASGNAGLISIPKTSVLRADNVLTQATLVIRDLLNTLLQKLTGTTMLDTSQYTSLDAVLTQNGFAVIVRQLLKYLYTADQNGLLDLVLPFINWIVGWSVDAQKLANPTISLTNTAADDYFLTSGTETVRFYNGSSGMLQRHGASSAYTYDTAYTIKLNKISADDSSITATGLPKTVAPGESTTVTLTSTKTTDRTVCLTFEYTITGKDGVSIGGTQYVNKYVYVSATAPTTFTTWSDAHRDTGTFKALIVSAESTTINPVCTDASKLKSVITGVNTKITNERDTACDFTQNKYSGFDESFIAINSEPLNALIGAQTLGKSSSTQLFPALIKDGVDVSTLANGVYDMGVFEPTLYSAYLSKKSTKAFVCDYGNLYYYDLTDLNNLYKSEDTACRQYTQYTGGKTSTEWTAYTSAMKAAAALLQQPRMIETFTTVFTDANVNAAIANLKAAITGLENVAAASPVSKLETALDSVETGEQDLNYQDYDLFTYFKYEKERNSARSIMKEYEAPVEPAAYINGSSLTNAQITDITAAETNATVKAAITANLVQPTAYDYQEYDAAVAAYKTPTYSTLSIDDSASKLKYYGGLMTTRTGNNQFLATEITCAEAQGYVEANYTATSWARYADALATAKDVLNNTDSLGSQIFDAKYQLMKAQRDLRLVANDFDAQVGLDDLNDLIEQGKTLLKNIDLYDYVGDATAADACAQLLSAVGYTTTYDANKDGVAEDVQLFTKSAEALASQELYYPSRYNTMYVDNAKNAIASAIANFESKVKAVTNEAVAGNTTVVTQNEYLIDGVQPGSIKGSEALAGANGLVKSSGAIAGYTTALSTAAGALGLYGTGSKVFVTATNNNSGDNIVVATYTVVIYGDVTGDGAIDGFDIYEVNKAINNYKTLTGVYVTAGDVAGADGIVDANDYAMIKNATVGLATIKQ